MRVAKAMRATTKASRAAPPPPAPEQKRESKARAAHVYADIADVAGVSAKDTKSVLDGIRQVAIRELRRSGTFKLAAFVSLKLLRKAASPAKTKSMFGKEVRIDAKPARTLVKATAVKQLRDALAER
jgi:nucleoid DNA-binding protein